MKIITEPAVYIVGRQTVDANDLDRFLLDHGTAWESDSEVAAEVLSETAGRLCYMSFAKPRPGGNAAYLQHLKEAGHGSCLEHAVWNLIVTGVSRSLTHELVRHRAGFGFSQLSQRYVDESVAEYVCPDVIAADPELRAIWERGVGQAHKAYLELVARLAEKFKPAGVRKAETSPEYAEQLGGLIEWNATERRKAARQAARSVLPNATETKVFVTLNARAARHFIEQRGSRHAEPEIRKLAGKILDVLAKDAPNLFGDYTRTPLPDGTDALDTPYRKV